MSPPSSVVIVEGNSIYFKLDKAANAPEPIVVTPSGIIICWIASHYLNASFPISVKFVPCSNSIVVRFLQL